jgi:hypothetical protein
MATDRTKIIKDSEARYPYRVDVPIPGSDSGRMFTDILDWCRENVVPDWDLHRDADLVRFYFLHEADAEAFRKRWVP